MNNTYSVYRHTSPSGKVYIGITKVSPNKRWRKGHGYTCGQSPKFAYAIKKYGWDNIKHEVLLNERTKEEAMYAEKYLIRWYKMHNISYNITDGGEIGGSLVGEEHPMYGRHETNPMYGIRGGENPNAIKVYQYTRDGHFITKWDSIIEAASTFSNKDAVSTAIVSCCKYKTASVKGYVWRYFYKDILDDVVPPHVKPIYQYDYCGNFIARYEKIKDVQNVLNKSKNRIGIISSCCNGKAKSGLGYFWSFVKYDKYPMQNINPQTISKMRKYLEKQINKSTTKK